MLAEDPESGLQIVKVVAKESRRFAGYAFATHVTDRATFAVRTT